MLSLETWILNHILQLHCKLFFVAGPYKVRDNIVIATKFAAYPWRLTAGQFVKACKYSFCLLVDANHRENNIKLIAFPKCNGSISKMVSSHWCMSHMMSYPSSSDYIVVLKHILLPQIFVRQTGTRPDRNWTATLVNCKLCTFAGVSSLGWISCNVWTG